MASPVHIPKSKFYPQVDVEWPPDGSHLSPQGIEMQAVADQSGHIQQSPPRRISHFSPRIMTNPEEVDIDYGLGSKFKNVRLADEFSVYHPKPYEERSSFTSNQGSQMPHVLSPQQAAVATETGKEPETKKHYGNGYVLSILLTVFSVEFAGALEIVYITPYFLKLDLNEWIDATFWMFPLVFTTLIKTPISILASHLKCQRPTLFVMMWLSVIGCFIFTSVDEITLKDVIPWEQRRILMTWLGLLAFCFIDVANEMTTVVQNRVIEENEQMADSLNSKASMAGSFAKIFGYFCGSLQALKISYYEVLERNMDTCFLLAGILMFVSMVLCFCYQSAPTKGYTGSLLPRFRSLKLSHFLPSFKKAFGSSPKMKLILASHFFAAGNIVMLSVYATSWVGQNVLKGDPLSDSIDSKAFEMGVSWGSLGLMITSVIILVVGYALHKMVKNAQKKKFKILHIVAQLLSALALFLALFLDDLNSVFLVIPLTGLAFQTFHAVPEILADILESEEGITIPGSYRRLLDFTFFYAQVLMWLVVPLVFIFFPERDDNQWGMLVAASSGVGSVVFAVFI